MRKQATLYLMMTLTLSLSARASSNREDDIHRIEDSAQIFQEIMGAPDKAIPQDLLDSAQCIAIIPAEKKLAFVVGGNYGKGLVTCRAVKSWSAAGVLDRERREFRFPDWRLLDGFHPGIPRAPGIAKAFERQI